MIDMFKNFCGYAKTEDIVDKNSILLVGTTLHKRIVIINDTQLIFAKTEEVELAYRFLTMDKRKDVKNEGNKVVATVYIPSTLNYFIKSDRLIMKMETKDFLTFEQFKEIEEYVERAEALREDFRKYLRLGGENNG